MRTSEEEGQEEKGERRKDVHEYLWIPRSFQQPQDDPHGDRNRVHDSQYQTGEYEQRSPSCLGFPRKTLEVPDDENDENAEQEKGESTSDRLLCWGRSASAAKVRALGRNGRD
jgi:hypothetical protein